LDGRLRPVRGILPATLAAQQAGFARVIVPLRKAERRSWSKGSMSLGSPRSPNWSPSCREFPYRGGGRRGDGRAGRKHANRRLDLADALGQVVAKWACEVAAAGGITCSSTAHRASARPCLRSAPRVYFLVSMSLTPLKFWRHSLAGFNLADELITRRTAATRITPHRLPASSAAGNEWPSLARFRVRKPVRHGIPWVCGSTPFKLHLRR
jgi:magnesium chelatase family protein